MMSTLWTHYWTKLETDGGKPPTQEAQKWKMMNRWMCWNFGT